MNSISQQQTPEREFEFRDEDFRLISRLVAERVGIVLAEHKRDMVYSRLARRLRQLGMESFKQYCNFLVGPKGDEETIDFVNAITTNLTGFFREDHHFGHLEEEIVKLVQARNGSRRLRIWSAGCSSGQEPYSIAMTVHKAIKDIGQWDVKILATDVDTNVLDTASAGEYPAAQLEKIPEAYRKRFISMKDDNFLMDNALKSLISFRRLNLLENWPMRGPFDVIFCRNVVIYFDKETQRKLFNRYADLIKPEGWLYIGHSENLSNVCNRFQLRGRTIYQKKT